MSRLGWPAPTTPTAAEQGAGDAFERGPRHDGWRVAGGRMGVSSPPQLDYLPSPVPYVYAIVRPTGFSTGQRPRRRRPVILGRQTTDSWRRLVQKILRFSVDSRLLRELGERLVGRPHIALAELIKNSYDADATQAIIVMRRDRIEIVDNGHGMTLEDFRERWMRIGTAHKETEAHSRRLGRRLTGSKGVGRLSVQLLADQLQLITTSIEPDSEPLRAVVDWRKAVDAGLLTEATASLDRPAIHPVYAGGAAHGTRIILTGLQQTWTSRALRDLAREIWPLRPPFAANAPQDQSNAFDVRLVTGQSHQEQAFSEQMHAVLNLWTARLVGRMLPAGVDERSLAAVVPVARPPVDETGPLESSLHDGTRDGDEGGACLTRSDGSAAPRPDCGPAAAANGPPSAGVDDPETDDDGEDSAADLVRPAPADAPGLPRIVELLVEFADGTREVVLYRLDDCALNDLKFEIRVFTLQNRQPSGITVGQARTYLRRFGGVHVYDAGFHLPYYGPDTDWLHVEIDHSHRLSRSRLLPEDLTEGTRGLSPLNFLPTNSRLFGVVDIDTGQEQRAAAELGPGARREALSIQVTRDRLADTHGYRSLVQLTRFALDLYAIREAQRAWARKQSDPGPGSDAPHGDEPGAARRPSAATGARELADVLERHQDDIPPPVLATLKDSVLEIADRAQAETESAATRISLFATLATAGITSLAHEHEAAKQNAILADLIARLRTAPTSREQVDQLANELDGWLSRARATRRMFSHMLDDETRKSRGRFKAKPLIEDVAEQIRPLVRGMSVVTDGVPDGLRLATGGYAEWASVLQNVLVNAANATLDSDVRKSAVDGGADGGTAWLRVQDTGVGVDLAKAESLFRPFERKQRISSERAALGLGGSGLGLTIVRTIAEGVGVRVRFEPPDPQYRTALVMTWEDGR